MNKKYISIPISVLVMVCIVLLALEFPSYGLLVGFSHLLSIAIVLSIITALIIYFKYRKVFDGENMYALTGVTMIWSFVFFLTMTSILNRKYATNCCETASYTIVAYQGRYTSGYGNINKEELKANQWILKVEMDGEIQQFVLEKDISNGKPVTRTMELEFCKGICGTE